MASASDVRVVVHHSFAAPAEDVFDAWIDPARIREWFGPGLGEMTRVDVDVRVGGAFAWVQRRGETDAEHLGEYLEVDRPRRLVFTWRTPADTSASRVSIDIVPGGTGCGLTLTHDMDPRWTSWMPKVEHGWRTMLDAMARALERGRTAGAAGER